MKKLNSTITKDADIPARLNIDIPNNNIINKKMNIQTITQSKVSIDGSEIVSTNNNNHECVILNNVSLPSSVTKDAGIHAKININIHNKTNFNIPTQGKIQHTFKHC